MDNDSNEPKDRHAQVEPKPVGTERAAPPPPQEGLKPPLTGQATPEGDLWSGRIDWRHFAGRILLWVTGNLILLTLLWRSSGPQAWMTRWTAMTVAGVALLLSGLFVLVPIALTILGHRFRLTSQRFFIHRGVLSQTIDQLELVRVDDVRVHMSLLNRLLGVGTVTLLSSDSTHREVTVMGVRAPEELAEAVRDNVRALRRTALHIEQV